MIEKSISGKLRDLEREELFDLLAKALQKQISSPVEITRTEGVMRGRIVRCTTCRERFFVVNGLSNKYCPLCGQKLRWSRE